MLISLPVVPLLTLLPDNLWPPVVTVSLSEPMEGSR